MDYECEWYVVHTYSGYENQVKANIEKSVENRGLSDRIVEVAVPMQNVVEIKDSKRKVVSRKVYPGYVLVKMHMDDETWYVVRNTRGVTSFVGPGSKPVPLTEAEVKKMGIEGGVVEVVYVDLAEGDAVTIIDGPFEGSIGTVTEVNAHKQECVVTLSIFGRDTPVELNFGQVEKLR